MSSQGSPNCTVRERLTTVEPGESEMGVRNAEFVGCPDEEAEPDHQECDLHGPAHP